MEEKRESQFLSIKSSVQAVIKDDKDLIKFIKPLTESQVIDLVNALDIDFLQQIIKKSFDLFYNLNNTYANESAGIQSPKKPFTVSCLNRLGFAVLKDFIINTRPYHKAPNFNQIIHFLPEPRKTEAIDYLGNEFLKSLLTEYYESFIEVIECLSPAKLKSFVNFLGDKNIRHFIKDCSKFETINKYLSAPQKEALIDCLDPDFFKRMIESPPGYDPLFKLHKAYSLKAVINSHTPTQIKTLVKNIGQGVFEGVIESKSTLNYLLKDLPWDKSLVFIESLDKEFVQRIIGGPQELKAFLASFAPNEEPPIEKQGGNAFFQPASVLETSEPGATKELVF